MDILDALTKIAGTLNRLHATNDADVMAKHEAIVLCSSLHTVVAQSRAAVVEEKEEEKEEKKSEDSSKKSR